MSRCRGFKSLNECINPEYHRAWGHGVTVKDCIDNAIFHIVCKAMRRYGKHGYLTVFLPDFNGKPKILEHIFFSLKKEFHGYDIELAIGDEKYRRQDIVVQFVPLTPEKPKYAIPVGWNDNLDQWTWKNVCEYGGYPTSSTQIWPPEEYKMKARIEAQRQALKDLDNQRQQVLKEKHEKFLKQKS